MRFLPLIPLTFYIFGALAQNSTSSNTTTCKETFDLKIPLNASALVEVPSSGTPPWYLGVTFGDKRNSSRPDQAYYGFLSTPTNSTAFACMQLIHKVLPATGTGSNGDCAGVLSDNCIDFLKKNLAVTQSDVKNKGCPNAPNVKDMEKACPPLAGTFASYGAGFLVSNTSCPSSRLPGPQQPPPDYENIPLFGISGFSNDESDRLDPTKFTWYDKYIEQPMLWTVSAFENGESRTSVVCVRPDRVEEGSRVPSTSDAGKTIGSWGAMGVAFAVMVAVMG